MKNFKKAIFQVSALVCFVGMFSVQVIAQNYHSPSAAITLLMEEHNTLPASASQNGFSAVQEAPLDLTDAEMEFINENPRYLVVKSNYIKHLAEEIRKTNDVVQPLSSVNNKYDIKVVAQEPELAVAVEAVKTEIDLLIQN